MNAFKVTVKNGKTGKTDTGYSVTATVEDAVSRTLKRVEETTPIRDLPTVYHITVEDMTRQAADSAYG